MTSDADDLIGHIEASLGEIAGGWAEDATGERLPFQIVHVKDAPEPASTTYLTLGLSRHELASPSKPIRQELMLGVRDRFVSTQLASVLSTVGELLLEHHRPLLRGEVLPPRDAMVPGSDLTALYGAPPGSYADSISVFEGSDPPTVFVQLVPISTAEAALIDSHGWPWFEEQLAAQEVDVLDLARASIRH